MHVCQTMVWSSPGPALFSKYITSYFQNALLVSRSSDDLLETNATSNSKLNNVVIVEPCRGLRRKLQKTDHL